MNKLTYVSPEVKYALVENDVLTAGGSPDVGGDLDGEEIGGGNIDQ